MHQPALGDRASWLSPAPGLAPAGGTGISRRGLLAGVLAATVPLARASAPPPPQAPALVLPSIWSEKLDPALYLVSEKYDGVRGYWDGVQLRFRSGRPVPAPGWFTAKLPRHLLDGELWLGRGRFDELSGIVRTEVPVDADWRQVRYMVFELPDPPEPKSPETEDATPSFAQRAERIAQIVRQTAWPQLIAVEQTGVAQREALSRRLAHTVASGGEGLVLHLASAPYSTGRSDAVMKLKPSLDAEATVVAHHRGKGKYEGLVGALEVRTPQGRHFLIGSGLSDALRHDPPSVGSVITYRYRNLTSTGLPRFATFLRMHEAL